MPPTLWSNRVKAYDISGKKNFTMTTTLIWTNIDFPTYGMMHGWMTQGCLACPYCQDEAKKFGYNMERI